MTNMPTITPEQAQERLGRRVATRLDADIADLPHHVTERLRASRVQALARRKLVSTRIAAAVSGSNGGATLTFGDGDMGFWGRIGSALPLVVLVAGLVLINTVQNDRRASEVAEVDAALLTDDLPPAAYADPGFVQFLKAERE